jgi:ABC-2 type transport system permease protein
LGSLFFGALAIALSVRLRSSETFQVVSTFLFFVFLFTSSVFYPAEKAPVAIKTISYLNPLTYITDIFRAGLLGLDAPLLGLEATALVGLSAAMFVLAIFSFNKIKV